jgi:type IV pilus assembly protein PilV
MTHNQQGVGLIEVMVSLLLLAVAVLGFSAMQMSAIKATDESLERTQSLVMMRNMGEKIRLNPTAITTYQTAINSPATSAPSTSCGLYGTDTTACTPAQLATAEAYLYTQDMSNYGFTVNLHPCPSTGGQAATNIMYSWCLLSAWGETTPTIGTNTEVDCLTSQVVNEDDSVTKGGVYHPDATCMFMEIT